MNSWLLLAMSRIIACLLYYAIFLVGYCLAWADFKPKHLRGSRIGAAPKGDNTLGISAIEPKIRRNPLSDSQLGLSSLDNAMFDASTQRRLRMEELLRRYAEERPDGAAMVLRNWLRENE